MNRPTRQMARFAGILLLAGLCAPPTAVSAADLAPPRRPRDLAPGVMQTVDPQRQLAESFSRRDIVELATGNPDFDWAKQRAFRHAVWNLEFQFKPVRMIWVDVPQEGGRMERKLIWYMVYSVTNKKLDPNQAGADAKPPQYGWMVPVKQPDGNYNVRYEDKPIRFRPEFRLYAPEFDKETGSLKQYKADSIIPVAMGPITQREDPARRFQTTVEMCREIAVGETVWGVAMWKDVNPKIDRFSILVRGLTSAYVWDDVPGVYKPGGRVGDGRRLQQKTLKINFWRPGDEYFEHEREIRYGVPGEVDYEWQYR